MKLRFTILTVLLLAAGAVVADPGGDTDERAILAFDHGQQPAGSFEPGEEADLPAYLTDSEADVLEGPETVMVATDVPL